MAYRILRNAAALSEFVAGFTGDCGETAELAALHSAIGLPLDAATLRAVVGRSQAIGASSNGSEPLSTIDRDLANLHVPHTTYAYAEPFGVDWQAIAAQSAGIRPIIIEVSHAGALPGDESGVHYHFVCIVGCDSDVLLVADGDNTAARAGQLVRYTSAQLAAAGVCGLITVDVDCQDMSATGGATPVAVDTTGLGAGMAAYAEAHNVSQVSGGEHYYDEVNSFCGLSDGTVLWFDKSTGQIKADAAAWVATALWDKLQAAQQQNATLQAQVLNLMAQVAQLKQQPPAPSQPAPAQPAQPPVVVQIGTGNLDPQLGQAIINLADVLITIGFNQQQQQQKAS